MIIVDKVENGPVLLCPDIFKDDRGYFYESFNDKFFRENVCDTTFVQDNQSCSSYGVVRGMHFQKGEFAQAKLVRVVKGAVVDVVLDIREDSPNYGKFYGYYLSSENHYQLFIPRGFAHGFVSLHNDTIFQYKCDNPYNKESEGSYRYDSFGFDWTEYIPKDKMVVSDKDQKAPYFNKHGNKKKVEISKDAILSICIAHVGDYSASEIPFVQDIYASVMTGPMETTEVKLLSYSSTDLFNPGDFSAYKQINVLNEQTGYKGALSPDLREVIRFYKYE